MAQDHKSKKQSSGDNGLVSNKAKNQKNKQPDLITIKGKEVKVDELIDQYNLLAQKYDKLKKRRTKALRRFKREKQLKPFQVELIRLQQYLEKTSKRMIILFEGRDASGKGGTIRRITRYMNQKHYRVVALGKPTEEQRTQWFFQKYVARFPTGGEIVLFDRSWYNRGMVERVFGFCTEEEYENFMHGVVGFEKDLVRQGTILVKLYFSVNQEEQAVRFERRKTDPLRRWKLSEVDLQAQDRWDEFTEVKYEMLKRTHTIDSPWTIIRSDNKHLARLNAMKVILNAVPFDKDSQLDLVPDPEIVVSGSRELENLEAYFIGKAKEVPSPRKSKSKR